MSEARRRLVLATRNEHKLREFSAMLPGFEVVALPTAVDLPPETEDTFAGNALIKASAAARATGEMAIADDSGICASALGGQPGVFSARFAGEGASDEQNLRLLLDRLAGEQDRRVEYVCAIALVDPDGEERLFEGRCSGRATTEPRGTGGFGYDPVVVPDDLHDGRTMAELAPAEKDAISHRGRAARELAAWLTDRER